MIGYYRFLILPRNSLCVCYCLTIFHANRFLVWKLRVKGRAGGQSDINVRLGVSGPTGNGRLSVFLTPQMPGPQTLINGVPSNVRHLVTAQPPLYIIKTFFRDSIRILYIYLLRFASHELS